jgi:Plasmid encoded RepA protein
MDSPRGQLELLGLEEALRRADAAGATPSERRRLRDRLETAHDMLTALPMPEELAFLHSGLCQTFLPHARPASDDAIWRRKAGRFTLLVSPGVMDDGRRVARVGVPYGTKARLILIYLQSEGVKGRVVPLGASMSAWIRSLGLAVTGGPRGSIAAVREQALRIARCSFTLQWDATDAAGNVQTLVRDTQIVEGLELWTAPSGAGGRWPETVELSTKFYEHLKEHAVPLDKRAIAHLAGNSLGLDLYTLFAYRLPRLQGGLHLSWLQLRDQLGSGEAHTRSLAQRIRDVLPAIAAVYPDAKVEATRHGLMLRPSLPAVPRTAVRVRGLGLIAAER